MKKTLFMFIFVVFIVLILSGKFTAFISGSYNGKITDSQTGAANEGLVILVQWMEVKGLLRKSHKETIRKFLYTCLSVDSRISYKKTF